jgi:hypothetical protein
VQTKNRSMKIGDALVGMKRRGSQLEMVVSEIVGGTVWTTRNMAGVRKKQKLGKIIVTYLLRQNMMSGEESRKRQGVHG